MQIANGTHAGTGGNWVYDGLGFKPRLLIVRHSTAGVWMFREGRNGYCFRPWAFQESYLPTYVVSMDALGFTFGSLFNGVGSTSIWTAFEADDNVLRVGKYDGDNQDGRQITCGTGFVPTYVHVGHALSGTDKGNDWANPPGGDIVGYLAWELYWSSNYIQGTWANGFVAGSQANISGEENVWFALKTTGGNVCVGQYDGNGVDDRDIVLSDAFQPVFVQILGRQISTNYGRRGSFRDPNYVGNLSYSYTYGDYANFIKQFNTNGFRVGTGASGYWDTNASGYRYVYLAMKSKLSGEIYDRTIPVQARRSNVSDRLLPAVARLYKGVDFNVPVVATKDQTVATAFSLPVHARSRKNFDLAVPVASKPYMFPSNYDRSIPVHARKAVAFDFAIPVAARSTLIWIPEATLSDDWTKEAAPNDNWNKETPASDSWEKV